MNKKPKILICNDDGILADGIHHLWNAVKEIGDVTIVAPAEERSASGLCITVHHPVRIHSTPWPEETPAHRVTGTPADCVKMALSVILDEPPDLILSGINRGSNAGRNVMYSGTVAACIEGAFRGIPGAAFSCWDMDEYPFQEWEPHVRQVVEYLLANPLPTGSILNVNFPPIGAGEFKGIRFAKQGRSYWIENPHIRTDPAGTPYHWMGGKLYEGPELPDGDITLLQEGYGTAVPIYVDDLTDHASFNERRDSFDAHFAGMSAAES